MWCFLSSCVPSRWTRGVMGVSLLVNDPISLIFFLIKKKRICSTFSILFRGEPSRLDAASCFRFCHSAYNRRKYCWPRWPAPHLNRTYLFDVRAPAHIWLVKSIESAKRKWARACLLSSFWRICPDPEEMKLIA